MTFGKGLSILTLAFSTFAIICYLLATLSRGWLISIAMLGLGLRFLWLHGNFSKRNTWR